jgi:hypothetical protein
MGNSGDMQVTRTKVGAIPAQFGKHRGRAQAKGVNLPERRIKFA